MRALRSVTIVVLLYVAVGWGQSVPAPRVLDLKAFDGTALKATYFAAAKPGPGVLLLHQCDQQRKIWDGLAANLAAHGIHVLTVDNRGFGESGGTRFDKLSQEEMRAVVRDKFAGDFDLAFQFLLSQDGVNHDQIGAGGASCGVNNAIKLARRHGEVKALVLLSGGTDRDGRSFLRVSKNLPVFTGGAEDDQYGNVVETMQWLHSLSGNSASRFQTYPNGRHGAEMFGPHPELMDMVSGWFLATLTQKPALLPKTNGTGFSPAVAELLEKIDQPGAAGDMAASGAKIQVPEYTVNLLGYEHLQSGDAKGAIEIFRLNVSAHPESPNTYDSLADAYLVAGQREQALANAKKALELLPGDAKDTEDRRKGIRESAEQKVKQLGEK